MHSIFALESNVASTTTTSATYFNIFLFLLSYLPKAGLTIRATGHLPRARDIKGALDNVVDKYHVMNAVLTFLDVSTLLQLVRSKYSGRTRLSF